MATSRGLRNNNPGNIRINKDSFLGEVKPSSYPSFKQFTTMAYGYRAVFVILGNYIKAGYNTIGKIINRWAPPSENNTASYINTVVARAGIDANKVLSLDDGNDLIKIVAAISYVENATPAVMGDVQAGLDLQETIKKK